MKSGYKKAFFWLVLVWLVAALPVLAWGCSSTSSVNNQPAGSSSPTASGKSSLGDIPLVLFVQDAFGLGAYDAAGAKSLMAKYNISTAPERLSESGFYVGQAFLVMPGRRIEFTVTADYPIEFTEPAKEGSLLVKLVVVADGDTTWGTPESGWPDNLKEVNGSWKYSTVLEWPADASEKIWRFIASSQYSGSGQVAYTLKYVP
jgi:hypothetical protein